jgi:phage terminase small subunit
VALTNKQRVFIAEYVKDFNATRAAIAAGYSEHTAYNIGWENVRKREIADEIEKVIAHRCMTKDEVLTRLAEHGRGDIGNFLGIRNDGLPVFDFKAAVEQGKTHLLKKLKTKTKTYVAKGDEDTVVTETDVEFELYDAQAALVQIGRHHKLFTDKTEAEVIVDLNVTADEIAKARNKATEAELKLLNDDPGRKN